MKIEKGRQGEKGRERTKAREREKWDYEPKQRDRESRGGAKK